MSEPPAWIQPAIGPAVPGTSSAQRRSSNHRRFRTLRTRGVGFGRRSLLGGRPREGRESELNRLQSNPVRVPSPQPLGTLRRGERDP
jgi:hypothetical protein